MTDTQKHNLESIIVNKGDCIAAIGLCSKTFCPMTEICTQLSIHTTASTLADSNFYPEMYKAAIKLYIEEFGKERLVEVLL